MIDVVKTYNLKVNFSKGTFASDEKIILIENDNKSVKFNFEFEEDLSEQTALLKIKHYLGDVVEKTISIVNKKAEFIFTNDILKAGNLKMSISLIGTDNEILTSAEYLDNIVIKETLGEGEEPSEEDISSLSMAIAEVNEMKTRIAEAKENGELNGDSTYEIAVKNGFKGTEAEWLKTLIGAEGKGIEKIEYTSTEGLLDTYTVTYTDETTMTFTIKNGNGISDIQELSRKDDTVTYRMEFLDGSHFDYTITEGSSYDDTEIKKDIENIKSDIRKINTKVVKELGVRYYFGQTSSKLERLGDAIGMTANATKNGATVVNDFDNEDVFKNIKEVKRDKLTHKLLATKGDLDYDEIDAEVMIDYPDTYWKFEESKDKTYLDIWLCNVQKAGYLKVDKFSVGKYPLSLNSEGKLQTRSGFPAEGWKGLTTWRNLVNSEYGEGACLLDWHYDVITLLYLIEFADFNSQSVLGQGHCSFRYNFATDKSLLAEENTNRIVINTSGGNAFIVGQRVIIGTSDGGTQIAKYRKIVSKENYSQDGITGVSITVDGDPFTTTTACSIMSCAQDTGSTDDIQASSGCMANDGKHGCSYRLWEKNSIFDSIDGIAIVNKVIKICYDPTKYVSSGFEGYEDLDYQIPESPTNGYIKTLGFDRNHPFCRITKEYGGSSNTHITDYSWSNPNGTFAARVGGNPPHGAGDGLFYWSLAASFGTAGWAYGARVLMYQI